MMCRMSIFKIAGLLLSVVVAQETVQCWLPIDVMFLQDSTGSFKDDLPIVMRQIPSMIGQVNIQNPQSWFGVAEFRDKPIEPFGESWDYCYRLQGPLSPNVDSFEEAYSRIVASGGRDFPESQMQALINVALDPKVGWRPIDRTITDGSHSGARVVVMSTDATPHLPGDMEKWDLTPLPVNPGDFAPNDEYCSTKDFPDIQYVKDALNSMNIYLAILTPDADAKEVLAWQWFSETFMEQPADFLQIISEDSSNLLQGLLKAIKAVTESVCPMITTEEPQTPPSETAAGTTGPFDITSLATEKEDPTTKPTLEVSEKPPTGALSTEEETPHEKTSTSTETGRVTEKEDPTTRPATEDTSSGLLNTEGSEAPHCGCTDNPHDPCCPALIIQTWKRPKRLHIEVIGGHE